MIVKGNFIMLPTTELIKKRNLEPMGRVQKMLDSEVLRYCDPMVPMRSGMLKKSGRLETKIGSGVVRYGTPYGAVNYYRNAGRGMQGTQRGGQRGRLWFERMKTKYGDTLLNAARNMAGGKR